MVRWHGNHASENDFVDSENYRVKMEAEKKKYGEYFFLIFFSRRVCYPLIASLQTGCERKLNNFQKLWIRVT